MDEGNEKTAQHYLLDLGTLLKEHAVTTRRESKADPSDSFALGRLMAYHEVISLMQQQARAFGLPLENLNLNDIDPERDLL
jgi:hypothetical protein